MTYRISVLMGVYNCASTLRIAIDSLLNQTYKNFKLIICDDGSSDNTYQIAYEYASKYTNVLLLRNEINRGLNFTLNYCLEYADTEYVARMDGDDMSLQTRFEKEISFLDNHSEFAVVSSPMIYFDENGEYRKGMANGEISASDFIHGNPVCHAPCMARTAAFRAVGGYSTDEKTLRLEDYHLWFRLFAAGYKFYMLDECLYMMRDDRCAVARRNWKNRRNEAYVRHVGYKMLGLPWYSQIFALVPIVKYFTPRFVYNYFHYRKK